MPYKTNAELPKAIQGLPEHAQDIWREAYNSAQERYPGDDERCARIAWGAVKRAGYVKGEDGRWHREAEASDFLFTEPTPGKPLEVLATGTFLDRNGREVEVDEDLLDALAANFEAGLAGQDVPVDVDHQRGEAAGWIRRVWREGQKLLGEPDWTALGKQLVGERRYRYVSATLDLADKVLKAVSLVNFPAVKGLAPVELSEGAWTMAIREEAIQSSWLNTLETLFERWFGEPTTTEFTRADVEDEGGREKARDAQKARSKRYGIAVLDVGQVTRPAEWDQLDDDQFGDPVNYRYPIHDAAHVRNALARFAQEDRTYKGKEVVRRRIEAAARKLKIGEYAEESEDMADVNELREQIREELEAEFAERQAQLKEERQKMRQQIEAELKDELRLTELAEELTGSGGFALPFKAEQVHEVLRTPTPEKVETMLRRVHEVGLVDFSERGSAGGPKPKGKQLPAYIAAQLDAGELKVEDLRSELLKPLLEAELSEYDLSKWDGGKEK